jgi:hypothetical protein
MKSLALRLTLLGLFVAAAGVAAYYAWMSASGTRQDARALAAFDASAVSAERDILELRGAQQGYVAAGQGDQFWASKVDGSVAKIRETLNGLRAQSTAAPAQASIDSASSALQDFEQMDRRARDYARTGQKLLASDLIFSNGYELTTAAASAVEEARLAERLPYESSATVLERRQLTAAGAAVGVGLFVMLLLVPVGARSEPVPEVATRPVPRFEGTRSSSEAGVAAGEGWSAAKVVSKPQAAHRPASSGGSGSRRVAAPTTATTKAPPPAAPTALPPALSPVAAAPVAASIDLSGVASLCSDLARVIDTFALPAILARAAAVLDAPGIVLWIADPEGQELSPIVTHGYPPQIVSRLGTILRDAENATASAFRTSLLQTVKTDAVSNGAIAAPLVTPAGCVGVMAAEVRQAGEADPAKLAVATIVAAQLATLVGPPSARAHARVEAAGA